RHLSDGRRRRLRRSENALARAGCQRCSRRFHHGRGCGFRVWLLGSTRSHRRQRVSMTMNITQIRSERLQRVMREAGLDALLLYGNAWQNDYLRYVVDFGILEGEGIALATRDG